MHYGFIPLQLIHLVFHYGMIKNYLVDTKVTVSTNPIKVFAVNYIKKASYAGISKTCPILNNSLVKLLSFFILSTVVSKRLAMLYKLSPLLT